MVKRPLILVAWLMLLITLAWFVIKPQNLAHKNTLTVYSYSSFTADWSAGPSIIKSFEVFCDCKVNLIDVGDAGTILQRLLLEKSEPKADVILGMDQLAKQDAEKNLSWTRWERLDWAPLGFVIRENGNLKTPQTLDDLLLPVYKKNISLQDPRSSSPGLQFMYWLVSTKGEAEALHFLQKLKLQEPYISPSWSTAYGLFKNKKVSLVFSYLTSPIYHWLNEDDHQIQPVYFKEGQPVQTEYVAILQSSKQLQLANQFLEFVIHDLSVQKLIMEKNIMLPNDPKATKGTQFEKLTNFTSPKGYEQILQTWDREKMIELWKKVF